MSNPTFNLTFDYKRYKDSSDPEKEIKYLKKIEHNIHILSSIDKNNVKKLSFYELRGEIIFDNSFSISRGTKGLLTRHIASISDYHEDLNSLTKFTEFARKYFKSVSLPPEQKVKILEELQKAQEGLNILHETYYKEREDRKTIIPKAVNQMRAMAKEINRNTQSKFDKVPQFLDDNINLLTKAGASVQYAHLFNELNGKLGNFNHVLKREDYELLSFRSDKKEEAVEEKKISSPLTIKDFKKMSMQLEFLETSEDKNYLIPSFLAEFLLMPVENKEKFEKLTKKLSKIDKSAISINKQEKLKLNALQESGLFPLSFDRKAAAKAEKTRKLQEILSQQTARQEATNRLTGQVTKAVGAYSGAAILYYAGITTGNPLIIGLAKQSMDLGTDALKTFIDDNKEALNSIQPGLTDTIQKATNENPNELIAELKKKISDLKEENTKAGNDLQGNVEKLQNEVNLAITYLQTAYATYFPKSEINAPEEKAMTASPEEKTVAPLEKNLNQDLSDTDDAFNNSISIEGK